MDVYSSVTAKMKREAADKVGTPAGFPDGELPIN